MEKLRLFRKSKKLTQKAMAKKMGITLSMYEKVEGGRAGASAKFMHKFKSIFDDADIGEIFFADNSNNGAEKASIQEKTQ